MMARLTSGALWPQPGVGVATGTLATLTLAAAWLLPGTARTDPTTTVVALALVGAIYAAYQFPVHLRTHTKVCMTGVPYYLLAVLLSPALAATAAGIGALAGELSVRTARGARPSDMATETGRRVLLILVGATVAHLGVPGWSQALALVGTALILGGGDILTFPLVLARLREPHPWRIIPLAAREGYGAEGVQYLLGLLGAYAAAQALWTLCLLVVPTVLIYQSCKNAKEMHEGTRHLLEQLADTVDLRDPYTGGHSRRVTDYCAGILRALDCTGPEAALILAAARVHDIGKIAIPDGILNKPGPFTAEERAIMETHSERGADFLERYADFARGVEIVRHHHESWDGTGYPHRLAGTAIPFGARVIAVADSFDAMTSDRPYRRGMPAQQAAAILRDGRAQQWDARVVDAFLRSIAAELAALEYPAPATPALHLVPATEAVEAAPAPLSAAG
jgi:hypothetical protein